MRTSSNDVKIAILKGFKLTSLPSSLNAYVNREPVHEAVTRPILPAFYLILYPHIRRLQEMAADVYIDFILSFNTSARRSRRPRSQRTARPSCKYRHAHTNLIDATALRSEEVNLSNNAILNKTATSHSIKGEHYSTDLLTKKQSVIQIQGDKLTLKNVDLPSNLWFPLRPHEDEKKCEID